jgi:ribonuclease HI
MVETDILLGDKQKKLWHAYTYDPASGDIIASQELPHLADQAILRFDERNKVDVVFGPGDTSRQWAFGGLKDESKAQCGAYVINFMLHMFGSNKKGGIGHAKHREDVMRIRPRKEVVASATHMAGGHEALCEMVESIADDEANGNRMIEDTIDEYDRRRPDTIFISGDGSYTQSRHLMTYGIVMNADTHVFGGFETIPDLPGSAQKASAPRAEMLAFLRAGRKAATVVDPPRNTKVSLVYETDSQYVFDRVSDIEELASCQFMDGSIDMANKDLLMEAWHICGKIHVRVVKTAAHAGNVRNTAADAITASIVNHSLTQQLNQGFVVARSLAAATKTNNKGKPDGEWELTQDMDREVQLTSADIELQRLQLGEMDVMHNSITLRAEAVWFDWSSFSESRYRNTVKWTEEAEGTANSIANRQRFVVMTMDSSNHQTNCSLGYITEWDKDASFPIVHAYYDLNLGRNWATEDGERKGGGRQFAQIDFTRHRLVSIITAGEQVRQKYTTITAKTHQVIVPKPRHKMSSIHEKCPQCGTRQKFTTMEAFAKHIDWHFKEGLCLSLDEYERVGLTVKHRKQSIREKSSLLGPAAPTECLSCPQPSCSHTSGSLVELVGHLNSSLHGYMQ